MKSFALAFLVSCSLTACAGMKEKMSEMSQKASDATKKATSAAQQEAAKHDPNGPWDPRDPRRSNDPGPPSNTQAATAGAAAAGSDAGAAHSSGSSAATAGGTTESSTGTTGDAGTEPTADTGVEASGSGSETTGEVELGGDAGAGGYVIDCSKPQNTYAEAETGGTEKWGWTDAKKGWFVRVRMANGMETTEEVKDEREASFLKESRYFQNGQLLSCTLMWTPRLLPKSEPAPVEPQDYESKTTDLPDETLSIGGMDVRCTVKRHWTRVQGIEGTVLSWTSDQVPNSVVKTVSETAEGPIVVYELLEFRR